MALTAALPLFLASQAQARILEDVKVRSLPDGYEMEFNFFPNLQYLSHSPTGQGEVLTVQLRLASRLATTLPDILEQLRREEFLSWNRSVPIPLKEIIYEGGSLDRPFLTIQFERPMRYKIRATPDLSRLIIRVQELPGKKPKPKPKKKPAVEPEEKLDVKVRALQEGFEMDFNFFPDLQYFSHSPTHKGEQLELQLRLTAGLGGTSPEALARLSQRRPFSWDRSVPIPLKEIMYEGGSLDRPYLTIQFERPMQYEIRITPDLSRVVIRVKEIPGEKPKEKPAVAPEKKVGPIKPGTPGFQALPKDKRIAQWMDEAAAAMNEEKYGRAIQLYTRILREPANPLTQSAQELLGLARERKGQLAHAKAEYEKYLELFPQGPGADRVSQRLAGLLTAKAEPQEKLRKPKKATDLEKGPWEYQVFGSLSQFYRRDESKLASGETRLNQSELASDLDFNVRGLSPDYDVRAQFIGSLDYDFRDRGDEEERINVASIEITDLQNKLYGRLGRQTLSTGGVFGRFDGALLSYDALPKVKINAVAGFPVQSTSAKAVETDKNFQGLNLDLGTFFDFWEFNVYGINQKAEDITDRRAVGGEVRYFQQDHSFYTLVDYDVSYNELNIFLFNGNWTFPTKTRLNFTFDLRKSPFLSSSNALIGQTAEDINALQLLFTEDEIRQLAVDRTAESRSLNFSLTQDLTENYQLTGEFSVNRLSGPRASGGVLATDPTGNEFFSSLQLVATSLFMADDVNIFNLRFTDTSSSNAYVFSANSRYLITRDFRVNPRFRVDFREDKGGGNERTRVVPSLRLDYRVQKWLRLEVEGGTELREDQVFNDTQSTKSFFVFAGYRAFF
ncbi:MAG: hypothetical protein ACE5ER_02485 [Nitrospinaceae bacterium]